MIATSKFRKAMHEIAAKKGEFTFFGLFLRADAYGYWDLVVSAWWLPDGSLKNLEVLNRLATAALGKVAYREIGRLVILRPNDPNLKAVISEYPVDEGEVRLKREVLFGLEIDDAIILRARPGAPRRARRPSEAKKARKVPSSKSRSRPHSRRLSRA